MTGKIQKAFNDEIAKLKPPSQEDGVDVYYSTFMPISDTRFWNRILRYTEETGTTAKFRTLFWRQNGETGRRVWRIQ